MLAHVPPHPVELAEVEGANRPARGCGCVSGKPLLKVIVTGLRNELCSLVTEKWAVKGKMLDGLIVPTMTEGRADPPHPGKIMQQADMFSAQQSQHG